MNDDPPDVAVADLQDFGVFAADVLGRAITTKEGRKRLFRVVGEYLTFLRLEPKVDFEEVHYVGRRLGRLLETAGVTSSPDVQEFVAVSSGRLPEKCFFDGLAEGVLAVREELKAASLTRSGVEQLPLSEKFAACELQDCELQDEAALTDMPELQWAAKIAG